MESGSKTGQTVHSIKTVWDRIRVGITLSMYPKYVTNINYFALKRQSFSFCVSVIMKLTKPQVRFSISRKALGKQTSRQTTTGFVYVKG